MPGFGFRSFFTAKKTPSADRRAKEISDATQGWLSIESVKTGLPKPSKPHRIPAAHKDGAAHKVGGKTRKRNRRTRRR